MLAIATPFIDWTAVGKILLAGLIGGAGVVIMFGLMLLGLSRARSTRHGSARVTDYALSAVAGAFCLAAVVFGLIAMTKKPPSSSGKSKGKSSAALIAPARAGVHDG